jgi:hypothetical protein
MPRWAREHSLSLAMFGAFAVFILLQSIFGWQTYNEELAQYGQATTGYLGYLGTGHFIEAVFENWESEFLQMGFYVLLTAYLMQKGSSESKPLDGSERPEDDVREAGPDSPRPVKVGGLVLVLYRNSLSLALLLLFAISFVLHLLGGTAEYNKEQAMQGTGEHLTSWQFLGTSDFWFQSMQNWQSEFLAVGALIVLSIFLRQHSSPESKPVTAPYSKTGA